MPCTIAGKAAPSTGAALDDDLDSYFAVKPKKSAAVLLAYLPNISHHNPCSFTVGAMYDFRQGRTLHGRCPRRRPRLVFRCEAQEGRGGRAGRRRGSGDGVIGLHRYCYYQYCMLNGRTGGAGGNHILRDIDCKIQRGGLQSKRCCMPIIVLTSAQSPNKQTNVL